MHVKEYFNSTGSLEVVEAINQKLPSFSKLSLLDLLVPGWIVCFKKSAKLGTCLLQPKSAMKIAELVCSVRKILW